MARARTIKIFSGGCSKCEDAIARIRQAACGPCRIEVLDTCRSGVQHRTAELRMLLLPAVVIDGKLAGCCSGRGVYMGVLRDAGPGQPLA